MRLYLSDLHLEDPTGAVFRTFARVLEEHAPRAEAIYLLGDLAEVWVGDDDDGPLAVALRVALGEAARHTAVHLLHGNRDFLFGSRFATDTAVTIHEDPLLLEDGTLLSHGDRFCIDDVAYQEARALFRSAEWQREVLGQSLAARRELAATLRAQSRSANANKAENIMDVAAAEVTRVVEASGAVRLIHGHTHRPGRHVSAWGTRYVLGAWERCGWMARQRRPGAEPELMCIPLIP